jgi:hypothetical protein
MSTKTGGRPKSAWSRSAVTDAASAITIRGAIIPNTDHSAGRLLVLIDQITLSN